MKQNVRRIVLLSVVLALVGALVLSSAVFARGLEGAGTTPNQPVSQQQVQAQNQVQVQQQEQRTSGRRTRLKRRIRYRSRCGRPEPG